MLQKLMTARGEALTGTPWTVYPRPQLKRDSYINLNGEWAFSCNYGEPEGVTTINVPFCPESILSGVEKHFPEGAWLCYTRKLKLPEGFNRGRVLLHVGAADQIAEVFVNRQKVLWHEGGYEAFTADITDYLQEENELMIGCIDSLQDQSFPYGKQVMKRGGMWYTPVSGIWQTVWLESVPETYIEKLNIENRGYSVTIATVPALEGKVTVRIWANSHWKTAALPLPRKIPACGALKTLISTILPWNAVRTGWNPTLPSGLWRSKPWANTPVCASTASPISSMHCWTRATGPTAS